MIPSVPTSKDTRVTSLAKVESRATIWFTVVFKSSISPCTSTLTVRLKSPFATAFVTSEIDRTWSVKFTAIFCGYVSTSRGIGVNNDDMERCVDMWSGPMTYVDIPGQVRPSALDTLDARLSTEYTLCTNFQCNTRDLGCEGAQLVHHGVDSALQGEHFALDLDIDLLGQVTASDSSRDLGDRPHLIRQTRTHPIHL